jgi:hypothetical protein
VICTAANSSAPLQQLPFGGDEALAEAPSDIENGTPRLKGSETVLPLHVLEHDQVNSETGLPVSKSNRVPWMLPVLKKSPSYSLNQESVSVPGVIGPSVYKGKFAWFVPVGPTEPEGGLLASAETPSRTKPVPKPDTFMHPGPPQLLPLVSVLLKMTDALSFPDGMISNAAVKISPNPRLVSIKFSFKARSGIGSACSSGRAEQQITWDGDRRSAVGRPKHEPNCDLTPRLPALQAWQPWVISKFSVDEKHPYFPTAFLRFLVQTISQVMKRLRIKARRHL